MAGARKVMRKVLADKFYYASKKAYENKQKGKRPSKGLKLQIDRIIAGKQETKLVINAPFNRQTSTDLEDFTAFTSAITSTNEVYCLVPQVVQGIDDQQRIGNTIQPISLTTKVNLSLLGTASQNVWVDVYFLKSKNIKDEAFNGSIQTGLLLNNGLGGNVNYDGTSYTAMLPVNKTEFSVIAHKHIKLESAFGDPNSALSGAGSNVSTNTYKYTASFSQKIPVPTRYTYEASTKLTPTNDFPFMMLGFYGSDTNGNLAPITARVYCQAQSHLYFKDA